MCRRRAAGELIHRSDVSLRRLAESAWQRYTALSDKLKLKQREYNALTELLFDIQHRGAGFDAEIADLEFRIKNCEDNISDFYPEVRAANYEHQELLVLRGFAAWFN